MPTNDGTRSAQVAERFLGGLVVGAFLGVITGIAPVVGLILAIGTAIALATMLLRARPLDASRLAQLAGILVGIGGLFLYGALNTFLSCQGTDNFCGHAIVAPFLILALAILGTGVVTAGLTRRLLRR